MNCLSPRSFRANIVNSCVLSLPHREFLRAIVAVKTGISYWRINLKALDAAYSIAFPNSTPINVNKKSKRVKK